MVRRLGVRISLDSRSWILLFSPPVRHLEDLELTVVMKGSFQVLLGYLTGRAANSRDITLLLYQITNLTLTLTLPPTLRMPEVSLSPASP